MTAGQPLDYAPPKPGRRRRLIVRIVAASCLLLVAAVAGFFALDRLQTYLEDRRLAASVVPPDTVMLTEDKAEATALRARYGQDVYMLRYNRSTVAAGHLPRAQWDVSARDRPTVRQRVSYYLGTRDAGNGPRVVLVGMTDIAADLYREFGVTESGADHVLYAQVYQAGGLLHGGRVLSDRELPAAPFLAPEGSLRVYDPRSDPADAARFSFHYSTDKGNAEVRGKLWPDDTVTLEIDEPTGEPTTRSSDEPRHDVP